MINTKKDIIGDTKKQIIDTAKQLFSKYSYLGVSMTDIAKSLNITKAALYYHFTGKIEIYKKVLDEVFSGLNKSLAKALEEKSAIKKLHTFIKNYLDFGFEEKIFIKALMFRLPFTDINVKKYITDLKEKNISLADSIIREITKKGKLKKKVNSKLLSFLLIEMMNALILEYSWAERKLNSEKITNQIISTLF